MEERLTKDEKKAIRQEEWKTQMEKERRNSLYKKIAIWGGIGLFLVLAVWGLVAASSQPSSSSTSNITMPPVTNKDISAGPTNAKVTLVEYADFQCPTCKAYYPVVKQLQQDYAGKLRFVYRFFPLESIHQNAQAAAQAAVAANAQGKFWEMHDKLFETQDSWAGLPDPTNTFVGYAKDLGMNIDQFKKDYSAQSTANFVNNAYNAALNLGLQGTPTFFVNGKFIDNPQGYQAFKDIINSALAGNNK